MNRNITSNYNMIYYIKSQISMRPRCLVLWIKKNNRDRVMLSLLLQKTRSPTNIFFCITVDSPDGRPKDGIDFTITDKK